MGIYLECPGGSGSPASVIRHHPSSRHQRGRRHSERLEAEMQEPGRTVHPIHVAPSVGQCSVQYKGYPTSQRVRRVHQTDIRYFIEPTVSAMMSSILCTRGIVAPPRAHRRDVMSSGKNNVRGRRREAMKAEGDIRVVGGRCHSQV